MPYLINRFSGEPLLTLNDGELNTSTSLSLLGKNYIGYGELQNENFIHLLENFAGSSPPPRPISGQTWFDSSKKILNVYDGNQWNLLGAAAISATAPESPAEGYLWYKTPEGTLYLFNSGVWSPIGPEVAEGFGVTRARSTVLRDADNNLVPAILITVNNAVIAIVSDRNFTVSSQNPIFGFSNVSAGITLSTQYPINGDVRGNSLTASRLANARTINGVPFDGQANITVKANPDGTLNRGDYLIGSNYNGSATVTWSVDATPNNIIGKIVARNSSGDFSANNITANLIGNVIGNVTAETGTSNFDIIRANQVIGPNLSGNAFSATKLVNPRTINGVAFDGTTNIDITVDASKIVGTDLNLAIKTSGLTQLGELENLRVKNSGITIGAGDRLVVAVENGIPTVKNNSNDLPLKLLTTDTAKGPVGLQILSSSISLSNSGDNLPAITPTINEEVNLGHPGFRFNKVYFKELVGDVDGNAETATLSIRANNISGGAKGSIPFQDSSNVTVLLPAGVPGQILRTAGTTGAPYWANADQVSLTILSPGTHILGSGYDGSTFVTWSIDTASQNVPGKIVSRDTNGDFSARNITASFVTATTVNANLNGNASSASSADSAGRLQAAPKINGVTFDGTSDINISTVDNTKVEKTGDQMSGFLTLHASPTNANHAATKNYVDTKFSSVRFTYGGTSAVGFTNQVGSFNDSSNYFDVFPPTGFTMTNLAAFIPSIRVIHFAGGVDANDSMRCTYQILSDRIRVFVQNTEQRSTPAGNWLAIWSLA
jgi:hypothetical protein